MIIPSKCADSSCMTGHRPQSPTPLCIPNLHEAFGIGLVVLSLFTIASWIETLYTHTQSKQYAIKHTQILAAGLAAICINPNHIHLLLKQIA